jgi:ribosomal protein S1
LRANGFVSLYGVNVEIMKFDAEAKKVGLSLKHATRRITASIQHAADVEAEPTPEAGPAV